MIRSSLLKRGAVSDMAWKLNKISSGHLSLENDELKSEQMSDVLSEIVRKLGESPEYGGKFGITPSAAAIELLVDGVRLTLGWDIWSGVFIMAWDDDGDRILENVISDIFIKNP